MRQLVLVGVFAAIVAGCADRERTDVAPAAETTTTTTTTTPTTTPATTTVATPTHDITGAYFAMDALPEEFAELDHLLLATIDENAAPAPLNGFLRPKNTSAEDYVLVAPQMQAAALTFTTTENGGISYSFTGNFERLANFAENPPDTETPVLVGTLTKMRNGRIVATAPVRFRYEAGG